MNWSRVASTICNTAQFLGGLSGGPLGMSVTAAALLLSQVLGVSDYPAPDGAALQDSAAPENDPQVDSANIARLEQLTTTGEFGLAQEIELTTVDEPAMAQLHE